MSTNPVYKAPAKQVANYKMPMNKNYKMNGNTLTLITNKDQSVEATFNASWQINLLEKLVSKFSSKETSTQTKYYIERFIGRVTTTDDQDQDLQSTMNLSTKAQEFLAAHGPAAKEKIARDFFEMDQIIDGFDEFEDELKEDTQMQKGSYLCFAPNRFAGFSGSGTVKIYGQQEKAHLDPAKADNLLSAVQALASVDKKK